MLTSMNKINANDLRKLLITALSFLFLFFSTQRSVGQETRLSLHIDPMMTWLSPDGKRIENEGSRLGFQFGLGIDRFFTDNYAFQTGLYISHIGGKLSFLDSVALKLTGVTDTIPPGNAISMNLQYLSVPVGLKLQTNEIGYTTLYANMGVLPMVNVQSRANIPDLDYEREDLEEEISLFNMGYYIGLGIHYSLGGPTALTAGVNYFNGFLDMAEPGSRKYLTRYLTLRLGVLF